jgi:predicted AlkP superfamily phosphohydrolase/phosphomutase
LGKQAKKLGRAKREDLQRKIFLSLNDVDWSKSQVYSMGNFGQMYINLKGREPEGIIEPGEEYQSLIGELSAKLQDLTDPESGESIIEEIYQGEDIYHGPYLKKAPDLMFLTKNMEYKVQGLSDFSSPRVFEPVFGTTGHHRLEGVLIGHWPGIFKESVWLDGAQIQDLAPTILYILGESVPENLDGKILFEYLDPAFVAANPVIYTSSDDTGEERRSETLTEEEAATLKERLRGLGYVT